MAADIEEVWNRFGHAQLMLIDIPIGLRERGAEQRWCEPLARQWLKSRASSVFTPPLRPALSCPDYATASARNHELSGRKLSRQAWGIAAKIGEVDTLLENHTEARGVLREAHPEILFSVLNAREPLQHRKMRREGKVERRRLLSRIRPETDEIMDGFRRSYLKKEVGDDDVYDALVAAVCAELCLREGVATLPPSPELDETGLPMEMVYPAI